MAKLQVDVELVLAPKAMAVRAGDRLMVLGGVVVGVYTGRDPDAPAAAPKAEAAAAAAAAKKKPAAKPAMEAVVDDILRVLRRAGPGKPLKTVELNRQLHVDASDYLRQKARRALVAGGLARSTGAGFGMTIELASAGDAPPPRSAAEAGREAVRSSTAWLPETPTPAQEAARAALLEALRRTEGPVRVGEVYAAAGLADAPNHERQTARRMLEREGLARIRGHGFGTTIEALAPPAPNGEAPEA